MDDNIKVNTSRIQNIEKRMNGLDSELQETTRELSRANSDLASLKTEMRIWGGVIVAGILGMIGFMFALLRLVVEHMISGGQLSP